MDVYEAGTSFTQNGPGCGVWLRTWNILQKLGLDQDLAKIAGTQPTDEPGNLASQTCKPVAYAMLQFLRLVSVRVIERRE